jgi:hypothetical protein
MREVRRQNLLLVNSTDILNCLGECSKKGWQFETKYCSCFKKLPIIFQVSDEAQQCSTKLTDRQQSVIGICGVQGETLEKWGDRMTNGAQELKSLVFAFEGTAKRRLSQQKHTNPYH